MKKPNSFKCVILAGGKGERLRPYTETMPKPMFQIGGKPILWHIMKYYEHYGIDDFVVCVGYKADKIREYFDKLAESWTVEFLDTGENASKGERLRQARHLINGDSFYLAYGDDLSDVDLGTLTRFHQEKDRMITLTAVPLISNFGVISFNGDDVVLGFEEKPKLDHWINGGFFCMKSAVFDHLKNGMDLEKHLLPALAQREEIAAYRHDGYWNPMNTEKDTQQILKDWESGHAPWFKWG